MLLLIAGSGLQCDGVDAVLLEREEPGVAGRGGRQERLLAFGIEVEFAPVQPEHAAALTHTVLRSEAELVADLRIARTDRTVALDLHMFVVVAGSAQPQRIHRAGGGRPFRHGVISAL